MGFTSFTTASQSLSNDEWLFGWNLTPGIVSVWANREGHARLWQRNDGRLSCTEDRFRPWLFAATLDDLIYADSAPVPIDTPGAAEARFTYQELDGAPESYRYLLTAYNGRALERALLAGAMRRLGRPINSLYELDEDYYRVSPIEQYLMLTGQVYFRGLSYADLHRLQFDLETTALDPRRGRIFMVAVRDNHGLAITLDAPEPEDEPQLIAALCALIRERDPDIIENHNLFGFDLPFLEQRAAVLKIPLLLGRSGGPMRLERYEDPTRRRSARRQLRYSIPGRECIDTLDAVRRHDFVARDLPSHRLKDLAQVFGIASEDRVYLAGREVYPTYRRDPETVRRYALDDVAEVAALSERLLGATFALAGMAPRRYERSASAGPAMGILEPMLVRAYLHAGAALPRQTSADAAALGPHAGGALHLFATGIAEQVVKADIASLYPSLMRIYKIGPQSDRLGVLIHLVDRLTELRLKHKDAARSAEPGSLQAGHHAAMQAAMKLIINSAYGYLGAGRMALFADRRAADEVTRRGREVLGLVVEALRAQGTALIEADTDGVYFAVSIGWTEEQEYALVQQIALELPVGLRLEYEGRYRAMLSHEVKNYALLTYGGDLIVRGVALRSSRSEPFGEQFLHQALLCALQGDIPGLRECYCATVAALRSGAVPVDELATRVRLSKTPQRYFERRTSQREAAYEALIAAGRTQWSPGERVRCYRARDGSYVWLPDETEENEIDDSNHEEAIFEEEVLKTQSLLVGPASPQQPKQPGYDIEHYLHTLLTSYVSRLRKAFAPEDFDQLFRQDTQLGLFDRPIEQITPRWIRRVNQGKAEQSP